MFPYRECLLCVLASTGEKSELTMVENGNKGKRSVNGVVAV